MELLIPTQVYISDVQSALEDDNYLYASELHGKLTEQVGFHILDRRGADIMPYEGQKAECLLEIVDAEFMPPPPPDSDDEIDPNLLELKYLGYRSSCHFFPIPPEAQKDGKLDKQLYRTLLDEQFADYGSDGFGLQPFDNQPILKTSDGYSFLINKYLYKDLLKKIRKGTWLMAKINEVELLSIAEPVEREQAPVPTDRVTEQQQQAEAMKVPRRKRWGVF